MKKIVIVSGSKRKGNTLGISKIYADQFAAYGNCVELIDLSELSLHGCDGCLACDETQICKLEDGFNKYIDFIRNADLIVMGSPARWRLLSGELKTFIDRLNPYAAVEGYADKNIFIFALGQSTKEEGTSITRTIESIASFAEDAGMNIIGQQAFYELLMEEDYMSNEEHIIEICKNNVMSMLEVISYEEV